MKYERIMKLHEQHYIV